MSKTNLYEWEERPDALLEFGFSRVEEDTCDSSRKVWYRRMFESEDSQIRFKLELEYELFIGDDPSASWLENTDYALEGIYLRVIERRMERGDDDGYDVATQRPRHIDRYPLNVRYLEDLLSLIEMLRSR